MHHAPFVKPCLFGPILSIIISGPPVFNRTTSPALNSWFIAKFFRRLTKQQPRELILLRFQEWLADWRRDRNWDTTNQCRLLHCGQLSHRSHWSAWFHGFVTISPSGAAARQERKRMELFPPDSLQWTLPFALAVCQSQSVRSLSRDALSRGMSSIA
jgi:hypothetical protein